MRQPWSQAAGDVETIDVILVEDEVPDAFLALLHELALEAIALRASSPGDPRPEPATEQAQHPPAPDAHAATRLLRRLGRRRVAQLAVLAVAAAAVAVVPGVIDARSAAARLAVLVTNPSVLELVTGPPVELWRTPGRAVGGLAPDLANGVELGAEEEYALPGGARATWAWHPDGNSGQGSVTTKDGGWVFGLWGPPLVPPITDGSQAGTLVVLTAAGDRLLGRDLRTGRSRWSVAYDGAVPVRAAAQVDGVLLLDDGSAMTAIDVRTGGGLWRAPIACDVTRGAALVDGEVVLLPVRDGATTLELAAVRIADGALLWRTAMPAGTVSLTVVDHHLVASTGDALVGLG